MEYRKIIVQHALSEADEKPDERVDLSRWARLIANGHMSFPTELSPQAQEALARKVSTVRKQRLLNYIARAIAADILRSQEP